MRHSSFRLRQQRGAILVTSLLLLLILTVLGVAMMKMTNMQERMAGNTRDLNLALQASEAALRDAETQISKLPANWDNAVGFTTNAGCAYCARDTLPVDLDDPSRYNWAAEAQEFGGAGKQFGRLAEDPRFVVEEARQVCDGGNEPGCPDGGRQFFTITARSTGTTGQSNTVLQSTYARHF